MSADPQHDDLNRDQGHANPQEPIRSPFSQALETWDAWSMASSMRRALRLAREQDNREVLARFEQYPEWTTGPGPLDALRANRELVEDLTGWRWLAMRDAREQGQSWHEIGRTLEQTGEQARAFYLDKVSGQRWLAEQYPKLGYDPRWLELAEPNAADRAADRPAPQARREDGHERC
jgi:hypothetical protein